MAALRVAAADRTTLTIAHRLRTVRFADRIIVLERGRVVEDGTHSELLRRHERYAALYELQSGTDRRDDAAAVAGPGLFGSSSN